MVLSRNKGIMLIDTLLAVIISSVVIVSVGSMIRRMYYAQTRIESRWNALLACNSILEYSSSLGTECDTMVITGGDRIQVITLRGTISQDEIGYLSTAYWRDPISGSLNSLKLGRVSIIAPG